jgi:integrase
MRRGELFGQQWPHVDFARGVLLVTRSKTVAGEGREIPLTSRTLSVLRGRAQPEGHVFQYRDRGLGTVKTAWKSTLRRAALRHVRFHDLRHAFNTRLLEAGVLPDVRKALMGHTSGGGVHAHYTHVELPLKRKAIAALERWWLEQSMEIDRTEQHKEERHERASQDDDRDGGVGQESLEEEDAR